MRTLLFLTVILSLVNASSHALDLAAYGSYWGVEDGDDSWGTGAKVGIPVLTDRLQVEGRAYWFPDVSGSSMEDISLLPLDLGAAVHIMPKNDFDIYAAAGASYIFADSDEISIDDTLGAYAGLGLEYALAGGFAFAAEALVRFASFDFSRSFHDNSFDATGLTVNAGLRFRF